MVAGCTLPSVLCKVRAFKLKEHSLDVVVSYNLLSVYYFLHPALLYEHVA